MYAGPQTIVADAPLSTIPVYVREGAIIPRGDILKANNNWDQDWEPNLRVEFFPSNETASEFDYYTGTGVRSIKMLPRPGAITITMDDLGLPGSLEVYCSAVRSVKKNGSLLRKRDDYDYDSATRKLTIPFSGATSLELVGAVSVFSSAKQH